MLRYVWVVVRGASNVKSGRSVCCATCAAVVVMSHGGDDVRPSVVLFVRVIILVCVLSSIVIERNKEKRVGCAGVHFCTRGLPGTCLRWQQGVWMCVGVAVWQHTFRSVRCATVRCVEHNRL